MNGYSLSERLILKIKQFRGVLIMKLLGSAMFNIHEELVGGLPAGDRDRTESWGGFILLEFSG